MNLTTSSQLSDLHPYLQQVVRVILEVAEAYGGRYTITSATRTAKAQWDLYRDLYPKAARPGCSQHQYGAAIDVLFEDLAWQTWWLEAVRYFGLTTVSGDEVHAQLIPGRDFLNLVEGMNVCPDPAYHWEVFADSMRWRDCLLEASRANARGDRARRSCPLPCGPVYGIPCR